jgi:hypothetical protein
MRMFSSSQEEKLKAHIGAIKNSSLKATAESNEHLRQLLLGLKDVMPSGGESQVFLLCQKAVSFALKSRSAKADDRKILLSDANNHFDLAIKAMVTELKVEAISQQGGLAP